MAPDSARYRGRPAYPAARPGLPARRIVVGKRPSPAAAGPRSDGRAGHRALVGVSSAARRAAVHRQRTVRGRPRAAAGGRDLQQQSPHAGGAAGDAGLRGDRSGHRSRPARGHVCAPGAGRRRGGCDPVQRRGFGGRGRLRARGRGPLRRPHPVARGHQTGQTVRFRPGPRNAVYRSAGQSDLGLCDLRVAGAPMDRGGAGPARGREPRLPGARGFRDSSSRRAWRR